MFFCCLIVLSANWYISKHSGNFALSKCNKCVQLMVCFPISELNTVPATGSCPPEKFSQTLERILCESATLLCKGPVNWVSVNVVLRWKRAAFLLVGIINYSQKLSWRWIKLYIYPNNEVCFMYIGYINETFMNSGFPAGSFNF